MCNRSVGAVGTTNIVDKRGKGIVPIGIESFDDIVWRRDGRRA